MSVDYTWILHTETQFAQAVLGHSNSHGTYIPPALAKGQFIYFAVDNSDFSEDTPDAKNTLHVTTLVVFQRKTHYLPELSLHLTKHPTCKSLPLSSFPKAELLPRHVPSNAQVKCPQYGRLDMTPSPDVTNAVV